MLSALLFSPVVLSVAWLLYLSMLLLAVWRTPWLELLADSRRQHVLFGSAFMLVMLWLVRHQFDNGLTFHFLGVTAVALLLDWPLAILAAALAQAVLWLLGLDTLAGMGINGLLRIAVPVVVCMGIHHALERLQPRNLFLYIFISGFLAAGLAAAGCLLVGLLLLSGSGALEVLPSVIELVGYALLVMFPEAFINGTLITGLVVYCPHWVATFAADRYLQAPLDQDPADD
ncbi:energy-coupling factor ABC transporter permease [Halopseudomonas yangmingensis]|uniref:Uncharacterized membrane protein n=1 Tax=Halopseudomonas yangmingensis TaxID=1720063 RepID=A0A1I4P4L3_9GAMM|nr:energy-coupling factor ABC transporter permease [Halopseudomonas yangmingensis]SFM22718.1 Uncharacterized membrane protein [Halopseudomonas yangmingensis]